MQMLEKTANQIDGHISRDLLRQKKILLPYVKNDDPYFTYRELQRILFKTDSGTQRNWLIEPIRDFTEETVVL